MEMARRNYLQAMFEQEMTNEENCAALLRCDSAEKICELMAAHNIQITPDEVCELTTNGMDAINAMKTAAADELNENDLEMVSGGGKIARFTVSLIGGVALGAGMGFLCGVCPAATPVCYKVAVGYAVVAGTWTAAG